MCVTLLLWFSVFRFTDSELNDTEEKCSTYSQIELNTTGNNILTCLYSVDLWMLNTFTKE